MNDSIGKTVNVWRTIWGRTKMVLQGGNLENNNRQRYLTLDLRGVLSRKKADAESFVETVHDRLKRRTRGLTWF